MNYGLDRLMVICLGMLVAACLISSAIAIASSVILRSTQLAKEVATRRVLGARRSHIAGMFLLENLPGMMIGLLVGSLVLLMAGKLVDLDSLLGLLCSAAVLTCAGAVGGWVAGRHAAMTPFSKSGLFSSSQTTLL